MTGMIAGFRAGVDRRSARLIARIPDAVAHRLAARFEQHLRANLDPGLRLMLALGDRRKPLSAYPLEECRRQYQMLFQAMDFPARPMARLRDHQLPIQNGSALLLREYRCRDSATLQPAVVFFHGGGFTIGSVPVYENLCRFLSDELDMPVFALEYRLAPEHAFPAWIDDACACWQWLQANALDLGIDGARIGVMGDSAGGNIAAVLCQQVAAQQWLLPKAQCLIYPSTDQRLVQPSHQHIAEGFGLDRAMINLFRSHYLPDPALIPDQRLSPLLAPDLSGQPDALLIVAHDPLRDEGLAYGERLREAGCAVTLRDYSHLIHGFVGLGGVLGAAQEALVEMCALFGKMLADHRY